MFGFTFFISDRLLLIKGPPDAVKYIFFTFLIFSPFNNDHIEKCSESIGIKLVLYLLRFFFINFQPQIIDSLFAIAIFFVCLIILLVGYNPSNPDIAFRV